MLAFGNNWAGTFCSGAQLRNQKQQQQKKNERKQNKSLQFLVGSWLTLWESSGDRGGREPTITS